MLASSVAQILKELVEEAGRPQDLADVEKLRLLDEETEIEDRLAEEQK